jgi:CheY-like chemotaxis protein
LQLFPLDDMAGVSDLGRSFRFVPGLHPHAMATPFDELAAALQCTISGLQVLVVDDDAGSRKAMQRVLEKQGCSVVVATDAADALRLLERTHLPVDLLVTDVQMPGMLGDALVLRVRDTWPDLPVLFVSGEPRYATLPELTGGRCRFLLKPFAPAELLETIQAVLTQGPVESYE